MSETPLKVTPEGVEAEPRKTGHRHIDMIVAAAAIFISLISLGVAVKHGLIMERLVAANSWPLLQYESGNLKEETNEPIITLKVKNSGVGPAIVQNFSVRYRGRSYDVPEQLLSACCGYTLPQGEQLSFTRGGVITDTIPNSVIRAGESREYLIMEQVPENASIWRKLDKARFELDFDVCYCSVLQECWRSDLSGVKQTPVDSCPIS